MVWGKFELPTYGFKSDILLLGFSTSDDNGLGFEFFFFDPTDSNVLIGFGVGLGSKEKDF